jgi:large-conductance mechanosensitive channel
MKSTSSLLLTAAQVTTAVAVTIGCTWNIVISSLLNQIKESVNNSLWVTKSSVITNIEEIIEKQFVQLIGIFLVLLIPFVICLAVATFLQVLYFFSALLSNVKTAVKKVESGVQQVGDSGAGVIAGKNIEWKRPNQFLQNPVFVQNGFTIDDICQG